MGSSLRRHPGSPRVRTRQRPPSHHLRRRDQRLELEWLEARSLCAISEIAIPTGASGPQGIAFGPDDAFWFTEHDVDKIGRVSLTGVITEYAINGPPNAEPGDIAAGPDGNLWFTYPRHGNDLIGRITPAGVITTYHVDSPGGNPYGITAGPDGNLWFTEENVGKVAKITPSGFIVEYSLGSNATHPMDIAAGPDGALWFTENGTNRIGRITTSGAISEYPIPTPSSDPRGIVAGPDGALWFTEFADGANKIGRITTSGTITEFPLPTPGSHPYEITTGPDGALWFTEVGLGAGRIGRITTSGSILEFPTPTSLSTPLGIAAGPDGSLWFTEYSANKLGFLTPNFSPSVAAPALNATQGVSFSGPVATFTNDGLNRPASFYTATIDWGDGTTSAGTITFDGAASTYQVSSSHTYSQSGSFTFSVLVTGQDGLSGTSSATATVSPPPLTATGKNVAAVEGAAFTGLVATFTDTDPGAAVSDFTATIDWGDGTTSAGTIAFDAAQGVFTVRGSHTFLDEGSYPLVVRIADVDGETASASGTATVSDAPLTASGATISATEGASFGGLVATFLDANPFATAAEFAATIDWGDGTTSAGAVAFSAALGRFTVRGTHTYSDEGTYALAVRVVDEGGSTATAPGQARVADAALTAWAQTIAATEGSPFSGLVATFTDANPFGTAAEFTATIDWGDGTTSAGTIAFDAAVGRFTVRGGHTYADQGSYPLTVAVVDEGGSRASATGAATVADAPLTAAGRTISATEGASFSGVVATFTDANPFGAVGDFTATIDWGDGTSSSGVVGYDGTAGVFTVSGTHTYADAGLATLVVQITDVGGASATASGTAAVADAPLTATGATIAATSGAMFSGIVATFTDADPGGTVADFSATIDWGDGSTSAGAIGYDPVNRVFTVSGGHTYGGAGSYSLRVQVADVGGSSALATGAANVVSAPIVSGANVSAVEGAPFSGVVATFRNDQPGGSPSDFAATIDWGDGQTTAGTIAAGAAPGTFTVSGSHTYAEEGAYTLRVRVDAVSGESGSAAGSATVADAPLTASGATIAAVEGAPFNGVVATFVDANPFGAAADFTATIDWGDGQTSAGTVAYDAALGAFTVSGSHAYARAGSYDLAILVSDVGGSTASASGTASISDAPLAAAGATIAATEGAPFSGVVATFTDANPFGTASDFSATIDWGDGTTTAGTIAFDPALGAFTVRGSHTYLDEGDEALGVTIRDSGGASVFAASSAVVADAPLSASARTVGATEGAPFAGVVASFVDANPFGTAGDFTATIDWGDGSTTAGTVAYDPALGAFTVSGTHTYTDEGNNSIAVTIRDSGGSTAVAASSAVVADAPLTATGRTVAATEGTAFGGIVATFVDDNPFATASDFAATIDWGDGQSSSAVVAFDAALGTFVVSGSHVYIDEGAYTIAIGVADEGGASASTSGAAQVADAPLTASAGTIAATEGAPFVGVVATFTDANPFGTAADFTATIDWGDGTTSAGAVAYDAALGGFTVSGSHTYTGYGSYSVSVLVLDEGGSSASAAGEAQVADAPLTASGTTVAATEGSPFTGVVATFTDANPFAQAADFTATIDWGDGTTSAGVVAFDAALGAFTVSGSHAYGDEGSYAINVQVVDEGGSTASTVGEADVADAPLTASSRTVSSTEGAPFSGVVATFVDANPLGTAGEFTATIDWGDGQSSAGVVAFDAALGSFTVSGSHVYVDEGSYAVNVRVVDEGGSVVSAVGEAVVADAPLTATGGTVSATEGASFAGVVASFVDGNPFGTTGEFTATIDWGDGTTGAGTVAYDAALGAFTVSGSHVYVDEGAYAITVAVGDEGGASASATGAAQVADAPLSASAATIAATEGASFNGVVATFVDANPFGTAADFVATIDWGDGQTSAGTVAYDPALGAFAVTGSHVYKDEGEYAVTVSVVDEGGSAASATGTALVDDAPLSASAVTIAPTEGAPFVGVVATFVDANPFGAVGDFAATIDWGDGTASAGTVAYDVALGAFAVTGSHTYVEEGTYSVAVVVADVGGSTASATGTASVADAPLTASATAVSATEGASFDGVVATFVDANPFGTASDFTATIDWGDGQTSQGVVVADGRGGFEVVGSHTYTEEGEFVVSVRIDDDGGASAGAVGTAAVADAALSGTGSTVEAVEGAPFFGVVATFVDANPFGTASDFTANIDWGDGQTSSGAIAFDPSLGAFVVVGAHLYAEEGVYAIAVTVRDEGGSQVVAEGTADVADAPLSATGRDLSATEGASVSGVVATFVDANPLGTADEFAATIDWGDGQTSAGLVAADGRGGFTVRGRHTYVDEGQYALRVVIEDEGGSVAEAAGLATVADAPLTAKAEPVASVEGAPFSGVVATFTDANPFGAAGDFTATISWGDGDSSKGTVSYDEARGAFTVRGSHTYRHEGAYAVRVTILDEGGSSAVAGGVAAVFDAELSATAGVIAPTEGQTFQGVVATFTDANPFSTAAEFTATIDWGDGRRSQGVVARDEVLQVFTVTGTHDYLGAGDYAVAVVVGDAGGAASRAVAVSEVASVPLIGQANEITLTERQAFSGPVATFRDPVPGANASHYDALIDWGDGGRSPGRIVANDRGGFDVEATHTYATPGIFAVAIRIADADGSALVAGTAAVVAEPPSSPSVTLSGGVVYAGPFVPNTPGGGVNAPASSQTGGVFQDFGFFGGKGQPKQGQDVPAAPPLSLTLSHPTPAPRGPQEAADAGEGSNNPQTSSNAPRVVRELWVALRQGAEQAAGDLLKVYQAIARAGPAFDPSSGSPVGVLVAAPEARLGETFRTDLLWQRLDAMSEQMSGSDLLRAETVVAAAGLIASVGYVIWAQRGSYLLFSVLTASPLWRQFDPLAVLDDRDERGRKGRGRRRRDKAPLLDLLERASGSGRGRLPVDGGVAS